MIEDADLIQRRTAYVQTVRNMGRTHRNAGLAASLLGALMLVLATTRGQGAHSPLGYASVAVIALGWALFIYVTVRRIAFVRANPYPQS